jgi:hypothetical protein
MELKDYQTLKVVELKNIAKERGLKGYSTLLKDKLIELLKKDDEKKKSTKKSPNKSLKKSPNKSLKKSPKKSPMVRIVENNFTRRFPITSSLAFIYQVTNPKNNKRPPGFKKPPFVFTYEDAIECNSDINSPKWSLVEKYLDFFEKDAMKKISRKIDKPFLLDLLKKEVMEHQKGNITFLHAKDIRYLVLDIISQLISGSYEGFKPKCLRKDKDENALDIVKNLFENPEVKKMYSKDHHSSVRKRLISANSSLKWIKWLKELVL